MTSLAERERVARCARAAGALSLAVLALGSFARVTVRDELIVTGDPAATAAAIGADLGLWRLGILADLTVVMSSVVIATLLYIVLRPVNQVGAGICAALRLAHAAVAGASVIALTIPAFVLDARTGVGLPDQQSITYVAVLAHRNGLVVALMLLAAHLAIAGRLLIRSGFIPAWAGWALLASAAAHLLDSSTHLLLGGYGGSVASLTLVTTTACEIALMLWLVTRGIDRDRWPISLEAEVVQQSTGHQVEHWHHERDPWAGAPDRHPSSARYRYWDRSQVER